MVHSQVEEGLYRQFGQDQFTVQLTADSILTLWVPRSLLSDVLRFLKPQSPQIRSLFLWILHRPTEINYLLMFPSLPNGLLKLPKSNLR